MKKIEVFVPAKVMLAGEYAVLKGGHALAATLTCGMTITVEWDPTAATWQINSDVWAEPRFVADDHTPQTDILCRAVQFAARRTGMHGGSVTISSDIAIEYGIGSSSALRLGVCGAFFALQQVERQGHCAELPRDAILAAWQLQSEGQGLASGYDIVTQYVGGLVEFSFEHVDTKWKPRWFKHHLDSLSDSVQVFVGGKGAPTTETMQTMTSWLDAGGRLDRLLDVSETLIDAFNMAIHWPGASNLKHLIECCAASRILFMGNPHFPTSLASLLIEVPGLDDSWSWKTTGAGGEDAILLIGSPTQLKAATEKLKSAGWYRMESPFAERGAYIISYSASPLDAPSTRLGTSLTKRRKTNAISPETASK